MKILFTLIFLAGAFWFCLFQAGLLGIYSPAFAVFVNLTLMGVSAAILGFLNIPLKSRYFEVQPFEKDGRIYRSFGVQFFLKLLKAIGYESMRQSLYPVGKSIKSLEDFSKQTRASETSHGFVALIVLALTIFVALEHSIFAARWLVLGNIFFNLYPIMAQRYNRPRIERLLRQRFNMV